MDVGSVGIQRVYCYFGVDGLNGVWETVGGIWLVWIVAMEGRFGNF